MDDEKSTIRYIFIIAGGAASWRSAKQSVTTSLTMEEEYVACYEATCHAICLQNFICDLGVVDSVEKPIMMYCDNTASMSFFNNSKGERYIDEKYFAVKEKV